MFFVMNEDYRALIKALPHIRALRGKIVVVKYGGNAMLNDALKSAVIEDLVFLQTAGITVALVHGGGPEIEAMLKATGKESRFVNGLRYTDDETMDIVLMVLAGKVNKGIVALLEAAGARAAGICGIDGSLFSATRDTRDDLGLVGKIEHVNTDFLFSIIASGALPVISSVARGAGSEASLIFNVNADTAAAQLAAALKAEKLVLMTDVAGLLADASDSRTLIKSATLAHLDALKKDGVIKGGMIPKLECCEVALCGGVNKTHIIDGRTPHALLSCLFSDEGTGTTITR
jgi:acetylglutamate kinase